MKAHEWLADPTHWTQGAYFRDTAGKEIFSSLPGDPNLGSTCLVGALALCCPGPPHPALAALCRQVQTALGLPGLPQHALSALTLWADNPARTHAEVYGVVKALDL